MKKANSWVAGGAILAVLLVGLPSAGEAAWWKFGSRADKQPIQQDQNSPLPPNGVGDGVPVAQAQSLDRLNRIEAQMRDLTGQIEQLTFQLRQLQDQVKRAQDDNEFRFQELEGGKSAPGRKAARADGGQPPAAEAPAASAAPAIAEAPPATEEPPLADAPPSDAIGNMAGNPAVAEQEPQTLGAPPKPLGTLTLDGPPPKGEGPINLSSIAKGGAEPTGPAAVASIAPTGDPRTDYEAAYGSILRGDYTLAEAGFRQFLATYPADPLAADAQYWLGESYFARGKYREAANEFLAGYKAYPKSTKGADTLFKLGASLAGLGERDAACQTYAKVLKQYPQMSNAMRQRVKTEQASASC